MDGSKNGLLQFSVLQNNADFVRTYFPEEDLSYYGQVFGGLEKPLYYSDYIDQKMNGNVMGNSRSLTKSTEAGRAMAQKGEEAAYVNYILAFSLVSILTILSIFAYFYLSR